MGRPREGWRLRDPRRPGDPYTVRYTNQAGRRVELTTGTSDPVEAASVAAELYARDFTAAPVVGRSRVSPLLGLDELFSMWLADLQNTHDRETVVTYTGYARGFLRHFGPSLLGVTRARMGDYQRARLAHVLRTTVLKERSALAGFLSWCEEQGVLSEDERPEWPRLPKRALGVRSGAQRSAPVDVTREQVGAFLAALPLWSKPRMGRRHAVRPRFIVAYETGLRPATLDALAVPTHWRPGESEIRIPAEHDKTRFGRTLPITPLARAALEYVVRELGVTEGPVFGSHDYREQVAAAREAAELPEGFAVYDLRHARVGHLLDQPGAEVRAVMFLVGHRLMTTTNRYVRGQETGARTLLSAMSSGEIPGRDEVLMLGAKEGNRTLTGVTPLEPESGETGQDSNSSADVTRQRGSGSDTFGQGFGDTPETRSPKSVADAARFLAALRASEDGVEAMLRDELLGGES